jgi:hypothetical protein
MRDPWLTVPALLLLLLDFPSDFLFPGIQRQQLRLMDLLLKLLLNVR